MTKPMPTIFFGHGNPMNALERNDWTRGWAEIGKSIPKPKAVLSISAHWYVPGTAITAMAHPETIHDFGGFPPDLYKVQYSAPGNLGLAKQVSKLLAPLSVGLDQEWGLDHGTWAVLCHVFPKADIPIIQLSIDETQPASFHYELGKRLAPLRDQGVLIIGSGNLLHNLHAYAWGQKPAEPFDWAVRFETKARKLLADADSKALVDYEKLGRDALLSIPTPDHYLPLLYVIAMRKKDEQISFPVEGIDGGSISMLTVQIG